MAEEGKASRSVFKLRCKKLQSGKSHEVAMAAKFEERDELGVKRNHPFLNESKFSESGNGQTGYGLRENPKKTWRAVDERQPLPQEKVCKQCGKGFQSMKALCGHMACHSDKEKPTPASDHDHGHGHDRDRSWMSENQKMVMDSQSDTETEEKRLRTRSSKSRKCKKISEDSPFVLASNGGSSLSELDGQEQEEVAKCLMMLSRDSGSKCGVNSVVESSDNNSIVVETKSSSIEMRVGRKVGEGDHALNKGKKKMLLEKKTEPFDGDTAKMEDSDSGYFLDECAKVGESDASVGWFSESLKVIRNSSNGDGDGMGSRKRKYGYGNQESWDDESARMVKNPQKKSKYECFNCKKVFKSYQALGGHRPCSKRVSESRDESGENSLDDADAAYYSKFVESSSKRKPGGKNSPSLSEKKSKSKKNKAHVCPFCNRVFKNGQAFGGHKRSHFLTGHYENNNTANPVEKPDLLDLNLPAPEAGDDGGDEGGGRIFSM